MCAAQEALDGCLAMAAKFLHSPEEICIDLGMPCAHCGMAVCCAGCHLGLCSTIPAYMYLDR